TKFEIPGFKSGQSINNSPYKTYIKHSDGDSVKDLFLASVESYSLIRANNKALKINMISAPASVEKFLRFDFTSNQKTQTTQYPLKGVSKGVPRNSKENGLMYYLDFSKLSYEGVDDKGQPYKKEHHSVDMKPLFQEIELKPDGTPLKDEEGKNVVTPWTLDQNKEITLVWTINANWKYTDLTQKPAKEVQLNIKAGDVQKVKPIAYDSQGKQTGIEYLTVPDGFCGYVIIPFDSMHPGESGWVGADVDGLVNLQKIDLNCFNLGIWPQMRGEFWIDEIGFYGPVFSEIDGAYDMGASLSNTDFGTPTAIIPKQSAVVNDPELDVTAPPSNNSGGTTNNNKSTANGDVSTEGENSAELSGDISDNSNNEADNSVLSTSGTTSKKDSATANTDSGGFPWWGWLIIGVVIVAGAGVGVFFYIKKRNSDDFENDFNNEFEDDNFDSSDESDNNIENTDENDNDNE
ncbi:MAG: hypothetical protein RR549_02590, partial [Oscillospiraceae bacterium]